MEKPQGIIDFVKLNDREEVQQAVLAAALSGDAAALERLPAVQAGHVTFGCLNYFGKVTAPTLDAWCRLLQELPEARLLLHAHPGSHRERVHQLLARQRGSAV